MQQAEKCAASPAIRRSAPTPNLDSDVRYVKGVGERLGKLFGKMGIFTAQDLLWHFPRRYEDRRNLRRIGQLRAGETACFRGTVRVADNVRTPRSQTLLTRVAVQDESGVAYLVWFNQWYLKNRFLRLRDKDVVVYGTVQVGSRGIEVVNPEWEELSSDGADSLSSNRIVPVYPLTDGLYQGRVRRIIYNALQKLLPGLKDALPREIRELRGLVDSATALANIHFPESEEAREAARFRLVYEEFFLLQLALAMRRQSVVGGAEGIAFDVTPECREAMRRLVPFELTAAQKRVIHEIEQDMCRGTVMNRLLQGDVGSGKTVVALAAMMIAIQNGYQAALMAPTEILAEQHYLVLSRLVKPLGLEVDLLTGSLSSREKNATGRRISSGQAQIVIGTHALIQEGVEFHRLGLVIVDEQHRFGVVQRAALKQKGWNPDVLVMTATPIPRTLALTVYGDLDLSVIDEMPPGRKPIKTHWKSAAERDQLYEAVKKLVNKGQQVYIVCPLIEESEKLQVRAATELAEHLQNEVFPDLRLALLHGQMKPGEKDDVMRRFRDGEIQVLVSTTVIEVGVDVPNACVMLVEDAERFGLAELHQLRGRVGRGENQSFCVLIADPHTEEASRRLEVMVRTSDGFEIAEEDLRIRGPGEFYGTRQSGIPAFRIANVLRDVDILEKSRKDAFALMRDDPRLASAAHGLLKDTVLKRFEGYELVSVS